MDVYYRDQEGPKGTPQDVARAVRLRNNVAEVEAVLREFFRFKNGAWINDVCEENLVRMLKAVAAAQNNGTKSGGRPKGAKDKVPRAPRGSRAASDKTQSDTDGFGPGSNLDTGWYQSGTQSEPNAKLTISHESFNSVPDGTGASPPDLNFEPEERTVASYKFVVPSSFPPDAVTMAPPPPAPPPGRLPSDLFDDDVRDRMLDAAADELDPEELARLRTGAPPPNGKTKAPRPPSGDAQKDFVFDVGLRLLMDHGTSEEKARSNLAKWFHKGIDKKIVVDAINDAIRNNASDPFTYISKICADTDKGRGRRSGYAGDLKGMDYSVPDDFIEGFPEADLMRDYDNERTQ